MKLYIAGPVTGQVDLNRPAFDAAAEHLRTLGHEVVVPHDCVPSDAPWDIAMRLCVRELALCDGIVLLPGWRDSRGASIERQLAIDLGMEAHAVSAWCRADVVVHCAKENQRG